MKLLDPAVLDRNMAAFRNLGDVQDQADGEVDPGEHQQVNPGQHQQVDLGEHQEVEPDEHENGPLGRLREKLSAEVWENHIEGLQDTNGVPGLGRAIWHCLDSEPYRDLSSFVRFIRIIIPSLLQSLSEPFFNRPASIPHPPF